MKPVKARIVKSLNHGSLIPACDNSGAKITRIISVRGAKTVKGRAPAAGVGDMVSVSIIKGKPDMRKQVMWAIVVRQKKEYRRLDGTRVKFADNAVVVLKDKQGNPKGTMIKGPIAKEAAERWPGISKIASVIL